VRGPVVDSASGVGGKKAMRPAGTTFEDANCDANRASVYAQDALLPPATQGASETGPVGLSISPAAGFGASASPRERTTTSLGGRLGQDS
jgi:hypothetical protein